MLTCVLYTYLTTVSRGKRRALYLYVNPRESWSLNCIELHTNLTETNWFLFVCLRENH